MRVRVRVSVKVRLCVGAKVRVVVGTELKPVVIKATFSYSNHLSVRSKLEGYRHDID